MATSLTYVNTVQPMSGGKNIGSGQGQEYGFTVGGNWVNGDLYTINLVDSQSGYVTQIGAGYVSGQMPTFVYTYNAKVYALSGPSVYFSGVNEPTTWNDPNGAFNGFIELLNYYNTPETLVAMAQYEGRLAFFSRWTVQIFLTDPNPANWEQVQVLPNMGTFASLSVQSLGDLDVLFLSDTGIRSLRVRDSSLYAFVNDIGSPIDALIQASLESGTTVTNSAACGIVEPATGRYWLYLNGTIYVLSYYPSNKIIAWSSYLPSYISTQNATTINFTPSQFVVFQGQVWAIGTSSEGNVALQYGGSSNTSFDNCVVTAATYWMDLKNPGVRKKAKAVDCALNAGLTNPASWTVSAGMNQVTETIEQVFSSDASTFQYQQMPFTCDGFHVKMQAVSSGNGPALLSSFIFHYTEANEK